MTLRTRRDRQRSLKRLGNRTIIKVIHKESPTLSEKKIYDARTISGGRYEAGQRVSLQVVSKNTTVYDPKVNTQLDVSPISKIKPTDKPGFYKFKKHS